MFQGKEKARLSKLKRAKSANFNFD